MDQDTKRGKVFTKLIRELTIAARAGGSNVDNNSRLRKAIEQAKEANMPGDNVKKAIQRGTGELPGVIIEESVYEGYGPGGAAVLVNATTDNKNRTTSELRRLFDSNGGKLGESGSVGWMFKLRGYITVDKAKANEDELMSLALELGAEDFTSNDEDVYEIITAPDDLDKLTDGLKAKGIPVTVSEVSQLPNAYVKLAGKEAEQMLNLMNALEEHEDVGQVYANFDIPKEIMEKVEAAL
jgi:YebC/PmpR family DNA-binding regulatory protein